MRFKMFNDSGSAVGSGTGIQNLNFIKVKMSLTKFVIF
jgi:hypothetical protein